MTNKQREKIANALKRWLDSSQENAWQEVIDEMSQQWIIDGEWSAYHSMVAQQDGWNLTHKDGMWVVTTQDEKKFPTDNDAREYVLAHEFDPENVLYGYAINAIMVGNIRG